MEDYELKTIEILKKLQKNNTDPEKAHIIADDVLCVFLKSLGYELIVEEYNKIDKWYS